ncbi:hypothetical protein Avbf_08349 [Armadillidium vulgare]|nr:hypothetical protein Avbf_08349 [Armadillidium vulgare]
MYVVIDLVKSAVPSCKICSDHFTPDCINPGVGFGKPTLKPNAIPTIFNFSPSSKVLRFYFASQVIMNYVVQHLKKRKEQEYFETESKVPSPKQVQELNNLQDLNTQSFDCHDQPISKPANYLVTSISDPSQNFEEISQTQEIGAFEEVALTSEEIFPAMDVVTPKLTSKNNKEIFHSAIINDHSYDISLQAKLTKAKLEIKRLKNKCSAYQNFIKNSKSKVRRLKRKTSDVPSILKKLKNLQLISNNLDDILSQHFHPVMSKLLKNSKGNRFVSKNKENNQDVKNFCLTLHFYSPKAYKFLRNYLTLPHPATLNRWVSVVKCPPGFLEESFNFLKEKALTEPVILALVFDEMAIKPAVEFDGKEYVGGIDLGHGNLTNDDREHDQSIMANEALFFMGVAVNASFKIPLGYALIKGINSLDKTNLLRLYLSKLKSIGVICKSITFDGTQTNLSVARHLGACLQIGPNFQNYFICDGDRIYIFLDPCHMLKLIRNTLAKEGEIKNKVTNKLINLSFDILNSRSPFAKGFKSALFPHIDKWRCWINESLEYLTNLNDKSGSFLCGGKKKVGFLGFYVCLKSLLMLADELLYGENPPLKYIMSYKFSQDSIEIFFSIIRSRLGNNNNPTPLQLRHCLRKILIGRINYSFEGGNCLDFRDSSLPEFKPLAGEKNEIYTFDHSYINEYETLTLVCDNIVSYISGFIVRKLSKSIKCVSCIAALTNENSVSPYMSLINIKNKGGLVLPSQDVIKTCRWCEKVIRQEVGVSPSFRKNIKSYLMYSVCNIYHLIYVSIFTRTCKEQQH